MSFSNSQVFTVVVRRRAKDAVMKRIRVKSLIKEHVLHKNVFVNCINGPVKNSCRASLPYIGGVSTEFLQIWLLAIRKTIGN